jgi:hypothetical protein
MSVIERASRMPPLPRAATPALSVLLGAQGKRLFVVTVLFFLFPLSCVRACCECILAVL